ncbi:MAG: hypothetical protein IIB68_04145 [Proteobacteria bacterium]|nr:hypothetical protein [Pseudomonadota bacterium]
MLPLIIISAILLGSSVAITASLSVVAFLFFLMVDEYPYLQAQLVPLLTSAGLFLLLTICCVLGFFGLLKKTAWRWWGQAAMWTMLLVIGLYYWPGQ